AAAPGSWVDVHDITMERGCQIDVTVVDDAQNPVKGAKVSLANDPQSVAVRQPTGPLAVETDEHGHAVLGGLPAGLSCAVLATHTQYMPSRSEPIAPLNRTHDATLTIVLERGASIAGKVEAPPELRQGLHVRLFLSGPRDVFSRALKVTECDG